MKKSWKVLAGLASAGAAAYSALRARSPGEIEPYLDDTGNLLGGSVAEIARVTIGGREQGMILKGRSVKNPVLLFLHGGPGSPEYAPAQQAPLCLEDYFTVCWWEQRGSGMSYSRDIKPGELTLERMIEDTVEVTNYLRERFGAEKIYLMGHSWGSFLGIHAAYRRPELYAAYIGVGQVTNQLESEKLAHAYMLETARAKGDIKTAEKLASYRIEGPASVSMAYIGLRTATMLRQGVGLAHKPIRALATVTGVLLAKEYTVADKINYIRGAAAGLALMKEQLAIDPFQTIPALELPVYIIHGVYDKQVSYNLSRAYFERLRAPEKHFYAFENSAHSPPLEEPEEFMRVIKEVINNGQ